MKKLHKRFCTFVLFCFLSLVNTYNLTEPIVEIEHGLILGSIKSASEGRPFYAFQGIPYAKPPIGPLRFNAPEPAEPWGNIFNATYDAPNCMQENNFNNTSGSEDCLKLSVYTPELPSNSSNASMTVYAYIHGGEFYYKSIHYNFLNPERFMNIDIVIVNIQYRLGALGFLATDDNAASGNFGLLDQNLALKWIQQNIASFGGDPNDVTLAGHSAGSSSVIHHYISPMSAGLFHRAIAASATPISPMLTQENPLKNAKTMAIHFNCSNDNTTKLIDCLRNISAEDIVIVAKMMILKAIEYRFVPSIETSSHGQFLTESPLELLKSGHFNRVPLMLGFTRDEGILLFKDTHRYFTQHPIAIFNFVIPEIISKATIYKQRLREISQAIRNQYYSNVNFSNQVEVNIASIKWMSDMLFITDICETAALISSHNVTTYLYVYNYVSSKARYNFTGEADVYHGDELKYLWYKNITDTKDQEFGKRFFKMWTNFATKSKPTLMEDPEPEWLPTPPGEFNYYDIQENFTMHGNYATHRMNFWWNTIPALVNSTEID